MIELYDTITTLGPTLVYRVILIPVNDSGAAPDMRAKY